MNGARFGTMREEMQRIIRAEALRLLSDPEFLASFQRIWRDTNKRNPVAREGREETR